MTKKDKFENCSFVDEQEAKMWYIKNVLKKNEFIQYVYCIETEATEAGFPDVLIETITNNVFYCEFKYAREGKIKFKKSQPVFFKKHKNSIITVIYWNEETKEFVEILTNDLLKDTENWHNQTYSIKDN